MFKTVGFFLLSLCLIGTLGEETAVTVEFETTPDPFGDKNNLSITVTTSKTETTTTSAAETTTTTVPVTTSKHETTTEPPTTTLEPTTTPAPETTTVQPITTVSPVTTTALPAPGPGKWLIGDVNDTCIRAKMAVQFKVFYDGEEYKHNLSPNATSDKSTCHPPDNRTQLLVLEDEGYVLTFIFYQDSSAVYVQNISLVIPKAQHVFEIDTDKYFEVKTDKSYLCNSKSTIKIGNATLEFTDVHLQAFMHTETDYSQAEDCADDDKLNDIVPISVACALCLMVVIILIGYLVTRRQSRQRGYQSV